MIIDYHELLKRISKILADNGVKNEQAEIIADNLVMTQACAVVTHGTSMLKAHLSKIQSGSYCLDGDVSILKRTNSVASTDSANTIGLYSAKVNMDIACDNAKDQGIFAVFSKNCNTFGAAFYYTYLAVQRGLIGIAFSNSPTAMAPWKSKTKLLGTNPIAVGIPAKEYSPVLFDMAASKVAKSKINKYRLAGEKIPTDWALDENGQPTDDPLEAIKGLVLPMAEHKGYGIALTLDMLSGVLSGAAYSSDVNRFYSDDGKCMNVGQTFIAIDPVVIDGDDFYCRVDDYISRIHQSEALGSNEVLYPGERKIKSYKNALENGVEIDAQTAELLFG